MRKDRTMRSASQTTSWVLSSTGWGETLTRAATGAAAAGIGQEGGSDAERDHVRQAVELRPEFAGGAGHARDAAVQDVEQDRPEDQGRRLGVLLVKRPHDGPESKEQVARREQAGQDGGAAAEAAP